MGSSKAWLPFGPELMLPRVVRLLSEIVSPIVVVAAEAQELPPLPAHILIARDAQPDCGPLAGLAAGFARLGDAVEVAYATGCDVPLLNAGFVAAMIAQLGEHEIAVPYDDAFPHPLAAVYRLRILPQILSLLAEDRLRTTLLFNRVDTLPVPVEALRSVDPELRTLMNLNRPEDYQAALAIAGFSIS